MAYFPLQTLRGILRELKSLYKGPVLSSEGITFLISEYRHHSQSEPFQAYKLHCDSLYYLCLLQSQRTKQELRLMYKGTGERSVDELAKILGFKLPKQYK